MTGGQEAYTHVLARQAVSQILYAQAERQYAQSSAAMATSGGSTPHGGRHGRGPLKPLSAGSIHTTESFPGALAEILQEHIERIGRLSSKYAELSGRSMASLPDVLATLNTKKKDLVKYAMYEEITFPHPITPFPVLPDRTNREKGKTPLLSQQQSNVKAPVRAHIEQWMPALPPPHTYMETPVYTSKEVQKGKENKDDEDVKESRKRDVQACLAKLREAKVRRKGETDSAVAAAAAAAPHNPFLSVPVVGEGNAFEEVQQEAREVLELDETNMQDRKESNTNTLMEVAKNSDMDQKRARVDRIIAESGGAAGSSAPEEEKSKAKGKDGKLKDS